MQMHRIVCYLDVAVKHQNPWESSLQGIIDEQVNILVIVEC